MSDDSDSVLDDVLAALETTLEANDAPVATAPQVASALPYDRQRRRVLEDLRALERADEAASMKVGANARVWWRDAPRPPSRPDERSTPPARTPDRDRVSGRDRGPDRGRDSDREPDRLRELVVDADLPGKTPERLEERRDALEATLAYIRENGEARRRDLFADVYPDHPAGYDSDDSWWKNAIQPALSAIADDVDELERATPHQPWRWE